MSHYLIEFRFFGQAKYNIKRMIYDINSRFHIMSRYRAIPHITLVGPFSTNNEKRLLEDFKQICDSTEIMHFLVSGYGNFDTTRVVYINAEPDEILDKFRWNLSQILGRYCNLTKYDREKEFNYHATLAMKLNPYKYESIKKYIRTQQAYNFEHALIRVSLIKNQIILCEYDFMLRRLLSRFEAKSARYLDMTYKALEDYLGKREIKQEIIPKKKEIDISKIPIIDLDNPNFLDRLINRFIKRKVFIISDTHFDHTNIIRYCNRPFKSTEEMNSTLLNNWNKTVGKQDIVFFLGDIVYGRESRSPDYWLSKLNGKIYFVAGNHEVKSRLVKYYYQLILVYEGRKFLLIHDPAGAPPGWNDWVIHGHHHNNHPEEFPFINPAKKRINVSIELINYAPFNIDKLINLI